MKIVFVLLTLMVTAMTAPIELGRVDWQRKIEPSLEKAQKDGKPVFLLFQEIPG